MLLNYATLKINQFGLVPNVLSLFKLIRLNFLKPLLYAETFYRIGSLTHFTVSWMIQVHFDHFLKIFSFDRVQVEINGIICSTTTILNNLGLQIGEETELKF